jgi:hypothetical protein
VFCLRVLQRRATKIVKNIDFFIKSIEREFNMNYSRTKAYSRGGEMVQTLLSVLEGV